MSTISKYLYSVVKDYSIFVVKYMCSCSFNKHLGTFYIFTTYMCTYQGRIPNEDQILCKNMMVYLKIYKWYNAALNKHHKKMSSTIKFNPIILFVYLVKHAFGWYCWMLLLYQVALIVEGTLGILARQITM